MEVKNNIAAKLNDVMKQRDLSIAEFSKELGIARSSLQGYIRGNVEMRLDTAELVSGKIGCTIQLVDGTQEPPTQSLELFVSSLHPSLLPLVEHSKQMMTELQTLSDKLYEMELQAGGDEP